MCDVLGIRNPGAGFPGVAVQAVQWCVQVPASYPMGQGGHEGSPCAHLEELTIHTVLSSAKIIGSCSRRK